MERLFSFLEKCRRESEQTSESEHFYEEVFSELIDGLKTPTAPKPAPNNYERISLYKEDPEIKTDPEIPFVPPRRSSIRDDSRPVKRPVPAKRPDIEKKSTEILNNMFDLSEGANETGSIQNLSDEMLQLSTVSLNKTRFKIQCYTNFRLFISHVV